MSTDDEIPGIKGDLVELHGPVRLDQEPAEARRRFTLREIGVDRICVDSVPLNDEDAKRYTNPSDWCYLVVSVVNRGGARFEVDRQLVKYEGMVGVSTNGAELTGQVDWRANTDEDSICPLCHHEGHGAGNCDYRTRWM